MTTRVVPTVVHGAVDHVTAPVLIAAPEIFRMHDGRRSSVPARALGAAGAVYASLTDYELAVRRLLPMRVHLALDGIGGGVLAASPWVLGSARKGTRYWLPHALVGALSIALALTTKTEAPSRRRRLLGLARRR